MDAEQRIFFRVCAAPKLAQLADGHPFQIASAGSEDHQFRLQQVGGLGSKLFQVKQWAPTFEGPQWFEGSLASESKPSIL